MNLRDYQQHAHDRIFEEWRTHQSTLLVLPTAGGKTHVFAHVIKTAQPARAMVLAHRDELIMQAKDTIEGVTGLSVEIEKAELYANANLFGCHPVVVSSIQTQISGPKHKRRYLRFDPMQYSVLIADECHHAASPSWREVIDHYRKNPNLKVLGVTATPDRADKEALGQVFETVAFEYGILDAIKDGWLVDITQQYVSVAGLDVSHIRTTAGDLNEGELKKVMETEENIQGICQPTLECVFALPPKTLNAVPPPQWREYLAALNRKPRRTIVFTVSVEQAELCSSVFSRAMDGVEWVCGMTNKGQRREILSKFSEGEVNLVAQCGVLLEGYDNPAVELIAMARPTKSRSLYAQAIGRSTRPLKGLVDGLPDAAARRAAIAASPKPFCRILDFVGNSGRHKLITCIAEGEMVSTNLGLVPIESITNKMLVWDGNEFVPNKGVAFRGEQVIVEYANLKATPDHKVWTQKGWKAFGECAVKQTPIALTSHDGFPLRESNGYFRRGVSENTIKQIAAFFAYRMHMWRAGLKTIRQSHSAGCGLLHLCLAGLPPGVAFETMQRSQAEVCKPGLPRVSELWRAWNKVSFLISKRNGCLDYGEYWTAQGIDLRPHRQRWPLPSWESSMEHDEGQPCKSEGLPRSRNASLSDCSSTVQNLRWAVEKIIEAWIYLERDYIKTKKEKTAKVYDILDCGPRHRFTVNGLLVSNCADILGGNISDEAKELAKQKAIKDGKPVRILVTMTNAELDLQHQKQELAEKARREREARKAHLLARVNYHAEDVNPFGQHDTRILLHERLSRDGRTFSEKQAAVLRRAGYDPSRFGYRQGQAIIGKLLSKPTEKQLVTLRKHGYDPKGWDRDKASSVLDSLAANGWRRPAEPVASNG